MYCVIYRTYSIRLPYVPYIHMYIYIYMDISTGPYPIPSMTMLMYISHSLIYSCVYIYG